MNFTKKISLENISFSYEKNVNILDSLILEVEKGDKIGIIGESGSGKSTLLKIISGLVNPKSGNYYLDGKKLYEKDISQLRKKIGYVKQDFYLLDSTLAENVAFGEKIDQINYDKLNIVIEQAQLKDVVKNLKKGVMTNIGEFGSNLSGGQKQRIAIARALYNNAEILIFDEATSALDEQTEKEIIETIQKITNKNLTIIMVAHRKSSLNYCNKIYEFKNGKLFLE